MKRHSLAIPSFILGIVSITIPFIAFFTPCPIISLVFGSIALHQINKDPSNLTGKGFAVAGVVVSAITMLVVMTLDAIFGITFFIALLGNLQK